MRKLAAASASKVAPKRKSNIKDDRPSKKVTSPSVGANDGVQQ